MTIKEIQLLLAFLGFDPGPIDGIWGADTRLAVITFQGETGLEQDGDPGPNTQKAMRHAVCYGLTDKDSEEGDLPVTGTFWDGIKHFTRAEFACKCGLSHAPYCDGYPAEMDERVVRIAQGIREHFGRPGHIVSGLRCPQHNADSGGVATSQHMDGTACDIRVEGVSAQEILGYLGTVQGVRYAYAINDTNVHYDVARG